MPLLKIIIRPSRKLTAGFSLLGLSVLLCLVLSAAPLWIKTVGVIMCSGVIIRIIRTHGLLLNHRAIQQLWVEKEDQWYLKNRAGRTQLACLQGDSVLTHVLIVLNFKLLNASGRAGLVSVLLCADSLDAVSFRRLRVYLNTSA